MSRTLTKGSGAAGSTKGAAAAIFVLGMALVLLLIVRARPGPEPLDPRSSASNGASALVELLERSGASVEITRTVPAADPTMRLLVLVDRLDDAQRSATLDFVEGGGVLIVADPASALHGGPDVDGGSRAIEGGDLPIDRLDANLELTVGIGTCTIGALADLRGVYVPDGVLFPIGPDDERCFSDDRHSFVIVDAINSGTIVGLGDNEVFTNQHLRRADNAGLATALLIPNSGADGSPAAAKVVIVLGTDTAPSVADVGSGDETLIDLVPRWVWMVLVLGSIGFVTFAVSRSTRVGRVLDEPLTTPRPGSELVAATGNLMQRAKHTGRAGSLLQLQLHRDLCRQLKFDPTAPLADLDQTISARTGIEPGTVETVLRAHVADDVQLLALSSRIDRIRKDVLT